jgi:hypothetical protein
MTSYYHSSVGWHRYSGVHRPLPCRWGVHEEDGSHEAPPFHTRPETRQQPETLLGGVFILSPVLDIANGHGPTGPRFELRRPFAVSRWRGRGNRG